MLVKGGWQDRQWYSFSGDACHAAWPFACMFRWVVRAHGQRTGVVLAVSSAVPLPPSVASPSPNVAFFAGTRMAWRVYPHVQWVHVMFVCARRKNSRSHPNRLFRTFSCCVCARGCGLWFLLPPGIEPRNYLSLPGNVTYSSRFEGDGWEVGAGSLISGVRSLKAGKFLVLAVCAAHDLQGAGMMLVLWGVCHRRDYVKMIRTIKNAYTQRSRDQAVHTRFSRVTRRDSKTSIPTQQCDPAHKL